MTTYDQRLALGRPSPETLDISGLTVWSVAAIGDTPVERWGQMPDGNAGQWVLSLDMGGVDLSRFIGGPVLADHESSISSTLGVVDDATIDGKELRAQIRFSAREDVAPVIKDVAAGIIRGVSVGFTVLEFAADAAADGDVPAFRAVRWQPYELSLTPTPAMAGAHVLSLRIKEEQVMKQPVDTAQPDPAVVQETAIQTPCEKVMPAAKPAEIRQLFAAAGLSVEDADDAINNRITMAEAYVAVGKHTLAKAQSQPTISPIAVGHSYDDPSVIRAAVVDAMVSKMTCKAPEGAARKYVDCRTHELAVAVCEANGQKLENPRSARAVFDQVFAVGLHGSSDFPKILQDAGNKVLLQQYTAQAPTYRAWATQRPFADFKAHKFLRLGDFPAFTASGAPATVVFGTASENREQVTAVAYTSGIGLSREELINDDLGALSGFAGGIGVRAAADENRLAYAVLAANAVLSDGVALFHSTHGNLAGTASTIDVANMALAIKAMRVQTSLDGLKLNLVPTILVCGPAKELVARQLLASIQPNAVSSVNPYSGSLTPVIDANITGNEWYLFASPAAAPTVVYGYVAGQNGPEIWVERDMDTRGVIIRAGLDFACGAIDYRGAYKNAGA